MSVSINNVRAGLAGALLTVLAAPACGTATAGSDGARDVRDEVVEPRTYPPTDVPVLEVPPRIYPPTDVPRPDDPRLRAAR